MIIQLNHWHNCQKFLLLLICPVQHLGYAESEILPCPVLTMLCSSGGSKTASTATKAGVESQHLQLMDGNERVCVN